MNIDTSQRLLVTDLFDPNLAKSDIADGYVRVSRHPDYPDLVLLNYTEKAQFNNHWDEVTKRCRGLIYDQLTMNVVAVPFEKFFNHDQHGPSSAFGPLPDEPFDVFDKLDGSLGIFYHYAGGWRVATRGSFTSDQAKWAFAWLHDGRDLSQLDPDVTYLAEIIYPANRVVVDYRGLTDCVLLGGYSLVTGDELPLRELAPGWPGMAVRRLSGWATLNGLVHDANNTDVKGTQREGYVIRFRSSGLRAKVKLADYKRIHGLFTETNEKTIWALLASGQNLSSLAADIPDELYGWCRMIESDLKHSHADLVTSVHDAYRLVLASLHEHNIAFTRKDFALMAKKVVEPRLMKAIFLVLDINYEKLDNWAWRQLEPANGGRRPSGSVDAD